ncbi:MAG TPA: CHAT domain-containing protein [Gemmatimonadales bacterium]
MLAILFLLGTLPGVQAGQGESSREIARLAQHAFERDSADRIAAAWSARLGRDSSDRAAALGLATLAALRYDSLEAHEAYTRLISTLPSSDPYRIQALIGLAFAEVWQVPFDISAARFALAADLAAKTGDRTAQATALGLLGFLRSRLTGMHAGLAIMDSAERVTPSGDDEVFALVACTKAPIMSFAGQGDPELQARLGLAAAKRSGSLRMIGHCYHALANVLINTETEPNAPDANLDSAITVLRTARDGHMLSLALFTRGYNASAVFDFGVARRWLSEAVQTGDSVGCRFSVAWAKRFLSLVSWQFGDKRSAAEDFHAAKRIFTMLNDRLALGNIAAAEGSVALEMGRLDEAEANFRRGLVSAERSGLAEGVLFAHHRLAALKAFRRDWEGARDELLTAKRYGDSHGHAGWSSGLQYPLGLASLRMNDLPAAERYLKGALSTSGPEQYLDQYAIKTRLAEVYVRKGDFVRALDEATTASDRIDAFRTGLSDHALRLLVFQAQSLWDEPDAGLATIIAEFVRAGYVREAFRLAERRKARTLTDHMVQTVALSDSAGDGPRAETTADPVELATAAIDSQTALLEYFAGPSRQPTTLFVATPSRLAGYVLPPLDSLGPDIERFVALLSAGDDGSNLGTRLRAALLDSVLAGLPDVINRFVLVPDGPLHRLPFDALLLASKEPLVIRYAITVAPSAAVAARLHARRASTLPPRVLAIADPRFATEATGDEGTSIYRAAFSSTGGLARLAGSAEEAREVSRYGRRGVLRLRDEASEAFLKRAALDSFRIIHLATHAIVDEGTLSRTALALSPGQEEDGFVGPADLAKLRLAADVVVLSACRTAGGWVVGGEGIQGLTAPLLQAGARSVLATLWPIEDRSRNDLIEPFYRGLADGLPATEALQRAKLEAIRNGAPPSVWATFTLIGDPLVRVPLDRPTSRGGTSLIGVLIGLLVVALLTRRRFRALRP